MADFLESILNDDSAAIKPQSAGWVDAPEINEGARIYYRHLTIGDILSLGALKQDGKIPAEGVAEVFAKIVCKPDGSPYGEVEVVAKRARKLPLPAVTRMIEAALGQHKHTDAAAKKP